MIPCRVRKSPLLDARCESTSTKPAIFVGLRQFMKECLDYSGPGYGVPQTAQLEGAEMLLGYRCPSPKCPMWHPVRRCSTSHAGATLRRPSAADDARAHRLCVVHWHVYTTPRGSKITEMRLKILQLEIERFPSLKVSCSRQNYWPNLKRRAPTFGRAPGASPLQMS